MSHHSAVRIFVGITSLVVVATIAPTTSFAGKEHCRKLTFDGVAGALSQDVVGFQVVRPDASVVNQSDPTVQVLANESAIDFMKRIVEDWCTEDGTVCPTFTTPPTSFCANSLGASSCKLKLKIAPKVGLNMGTKKKYIEICCYEQPDCKTKLGTSDPTDIPITVQAQVNAGPECPLDTSLPLSGEAQCTVNLDPIGVIQLAAPTAGGCRSDIASATRSYVTTVVKSYVDCHKQRDATGSPASCLTLDDVDLKEKIEASAAKLQSVVSACASEGSPANAGYAECPAPCASFSTATCTAGTVGAPCSFDRTCDTSTGALDGRCGDWATVGGCITCLLQNALETAATAMLGNPASTPLDGATAMCHMDIAQGFQRIALTRVSEALGCQTRVDAGKLARPTGGDNCTTVDLKGLIDRAETQATSGLGNDCDDLQIDNLDLCGATGASYASCLLSEGATFSTAVAQAIFPELRPRDPGSCPTKATLLVAGGAVGPAGTCVDNGDCIPGDCVNGVCVNPTKIDYGWTGLAHDEDVADKTALNFDVSCAASGAPCGACTIAAPVPNDDNCRCQNNFAVRCDEPFGPDANDCGGAVCECYFGPPQPVNLGNSPLCLLHHLTGPVAGTLDVDTADASLALSDRMSIHLGPGATQPCPTCVAGTCDGGARNGLACAAPAVHGTFGPVSLDCPPGVGTDVSGGGARLKIPLSTGSVSLPAAIPCDGALSGLNCPCAVCSLDPTIGCSSNADCAPALAGVCSSAGPLGEPRAPNACDDLDCVPVGVGFEGHCTGPVDKFCDGITYANGNGFLSCLDNSDCALFGPSAGACSLSENRRCFLDPIAEAGFAAVSTNRLVGVTCVSPTSAPAVNSVFGLPGPARMALVTRPILTCNDGVTQYVPGVGGCP